MHVGVRSQTRPHHNRDGAWLVGCCHLFSDLQGSGHYPQSPEQGEWMSLLQTFPIMNRPPRHQSIFYVVLTLWNIVEPGFMLPPLVRSRFLP